MSNKKDKDNIIFINADLKLLECHYEWLLSKSIGRGNKKFEKKDLPMIKECCKKKEKD